MLLQMTRALYLQLSRTYCHKIARNVHAVNVSRTLQIWSILIAFVLVSLPPLASQADWKANWIGPLNNVNNSRLNEDTVSAKPNQWICYRKKFHLTTAPTNSTAHIACDSKYWLWINGNLVVFEGQLKRGPTPIDTYCDTVDLTKYLKQGENTIAVLLWYFGKHGFSHKDSGQPGLLFQAEIEDSAILSDSSWKAIRHPAYGNTGEPHPNYRLPESNIRFDASGDLKEWQQVDYDDSGWPFTEVLGIPPCAPWGKIIARPIPLFRFSELRDYEKSREIFSADGDKTIIATLPFNAQVTPYLKLKAPSGRVVDIRTDNYHGGGEFNVRAEYVSREGVQEFESLGWMNGHEVHYRLPRDVEVLELKYRESGYDCDFAGSFSSDDQFLNELWTKARRTLYLEMRDGYFDCPDRERAQWWGDITLEIQQAFYSLDRRSDLLSRKAIDELIDWRKADGTLFSPIPAGNWDKELPMQMLASVGKYGFWTYYMHTGDSATIERVYPVVRNYILEVWQLGEDGLVSERTGDWTWGDWGENKDLPLLYNGWYYLALDSVRMMAVSLDIKEDQLEAQHRMNSIRQKFNKTYWNGKEYRSPNYKGLTDDRGHALAVLTGLAEPSQYDAIRKVFADHQHASPYMEKYVLEALFYMGNPNEALQRMKERFKPMVDSPLTTLWEGWGVGAQGYGGGSYNHAWSGGPLILLSQCVAGIAPLEPGYRRFSVRPQLGPLQRVESSVASVVGSIAVKIDALEGSFQLSLDVPEKSVAEVRIPVEYSNVVQINGKQFWDSKRKINKLTGVKLLGYEAAFLEFEVMAGHWNVLGRSENSGP
jgi:hypothetical protein